MLSRDERFAKFTVAERNNYLSEVDVRYAFQQAASNTEAARYLKVVKSTWIKYAKMYINPDTGNSYWQDLAYKRPKHFRSSNKIDLIINGEKPAPFDIENFKDTLIMEGHFVERCMICGFNEKRITDFKVPLIINFIDGDTRNGKIDNLELLCYNDYFLTVGNMKPDYGKHKK